MLQPRLLHKISVTLVQIDRTATPILDVNLHEPVGQVARKVSTTLFAQIQMGKDQNPKAGLDGVAALSDGYVLFRYKDLVAASITIEHGDLITQIGTGSVARTVDYYILGTKPMGHYQHLGGPSFIRAYFQDRQPGQR